MENELDILDKVLYLLNNKLEAMMSGEHQYIGVNGLRVLIAEIESLRKD